MAAEGNKATAGTLHRRGLLGGAVALPVAAGGAAAGVHPDAALIAACREKARMAAVLNASVVDMDGSPTEAAYLATLNAIGEAEPQTLEGWLAKAEAARGDVHETGDGTLALQWAWALMHDMRRLVAAGVVR
jgi:hypothetical protein